MACVSVLIPARGDASHPAGERYLQRTIDEVLEKAAGEVEVIPILDGYRPEPPLKAHPQVKPLFLSACGLRPAVNAGVASATGTYVLKTDAHCLFAPGFDETLKANCDDDWLVIPRRYSLDVEHWTILKTGRPPVDYEYIAYPFADGQGGAVRMGNVWKTRAAERLGILLDDDMSFQGSCWFCHRAYFQRLGPLETTGWGTFVLEPEELGNKVWLSGGRVVVNKQTWYAHFHKGKEVGRGYFIDRKQLIRGRQWHIDFFLHNRWLPQWPPQVHPYPWLIEKFWPVPGWPEQALAWFDARGMWTGPTDPRGEYVV